MFFNFSVLFVKILVFWGCNFFSCCYWWSIFFLFGIHYQEKSFSCFLNIETNSISTIIQLINSSYAWKNSQTNKDVSATPLLMTQTMGWKYRKIFLFLLPFITYLNGFDFDFDLIDNLDILSLGTPLKNYIM